MSIDSSRLGGPRAHRRPPPAADAPWRLRLGHPPLVLTAFERADRRGVVFARWRERREPPVNGIARAQAVQRKRSLDLTVRDSDGVLDPGRVRAAEARARALYTLLAAGGDPDAFDAPRTGTALPEPAPSAGTLTDARPSDAPVSGGCLSGESGEAAVPSPDLTLARGVAFAFAHDRGAMYAAGSRQRRAARRAADAAVAVLGPDTLWHHVGPDAAARVWRAFAARTAAGALVSPRQAERAMAAVYAVAQWLREHEHLPSGSGRPPRRWRAALWAQWAMLLSDDADDPANGAVKRAPLPAPALHTAHEWRALRAALPAADPRIGLAFVLSPDPGSVPSPAHDTARPTRPRLTQLLRATRRDLTLTASPATPFGTLVVGGRGRKRGTVLVLTPTQRTAIDGSLAPGGVLGAYEAAYSAGRVPDFPLFPGGRLVNGGAPIRMPAAALTPRSATTLFHALERAAGVAPIVGRGWASGRAPDDPLGRA